MEIIYLLISIPALVVMFLFPTFMIVFNKRLAILHVELREKFSGFQASHEYILTMRIVFVLGGIIFNLAFIKIFILGD